MGGKADRPGYFSDWGTPKNEIALARAVLGSIELDVASSELHNERVKADRYFDKDALSLPWDAKTVLCNPPGNSSGSLVKQFAAKANEREAGALFWVGFNLNHLCTLQGIIHFDAICIVKKRIEFLDPDGVPGGQPRYHSFFGLVLKDMMSPEGGRTFTRFGGVLESKGLCVYP